MSVTSNPGGGDAVPGGSFQDAQDDDAQYYIYASSSGKKPGENINVLTEGSPTDTFVSALNEDKAIILASTPSPTADLDSTDETLKWFQQLDSMVTGSVTVDQAKAVESFSFELQQPWKMTFSSAKDVLLYTFGPPPVGASNRIPPPGIEASGQMLTLGLDFGKTVNVSSNNTLEDLFKYAGAASMADYVPGELLDLAVTLETPEEGNQDPKRNAIWYIPASSKRIVTRLQFQVPEFNSLQEVLATTLEGFTLKSADVVFYKDTLLSATESGLKPLSRGSIAFAVECSVQGGGSDEVPATAAIDLSESSISLTFLFKSQDDPLSGILKWLASLIGDDTLESLVYDILDNKEGETNVFSHYILRRMRVNLDTLDPANRKLASFSFDIEISVNIGGGSDSHPTVFLLSYNWNRFTGGFGRLSGQLWTSFETSQDLDLLPYEEKWTILEPVTTNPATSIKITSLIPGQTVESIPDTLPSEVTDAYISLTQDSFAIRCSVTTNPPPPSSAPQPHLGEVTLEGSFSWGKSSAFELGLFISAGIEPSEADASDDVEPAILQGSLTYDSGAKKWELGASLTGLNAATLVEFFKEEEKAHVGPLISSIAISTLDVQYTYTGASGSGTSTGSEFLIQGDLLIAGLKLGLTFTYEKEGGFEFKANLNPDDTSATIGDVLASILGTTDIELPDFVYNAQLGNGDEDVFSLEVSKQENSFLFVSQLSIANVHIDFAQIHGTDWSAKTPSKRLFRVGIDGFPNRQIDLPLIGTLTQPLDELYFLWVQDTGPVAPGKMTGLTRSDRDALNSGLQDPILVKDKIKPDKQTPKDLLVAAGCHFSVIVRSSSGERLCLLDYEFMKPSSSVSSSNSKGLKLKQSAAREEGGDDGSPTAQAPYKKTAGPLSISNVGLKYKDKQLAIMFDATFQLGPLGFSLVGFSLGFSFTTLNDALPVITPAILGLATSFDQSPLSIAGVIRHGNSGGLDYYAGGLVVGWKPYQFEAAGFYGIVTPLGNSEGFKSVFIFAKLNGPLVTLEFAEINSLCGGFGYNSSMRLPTVDEVYDFPFIASTGLSGKENAMEALEKLVDPSQGGWFKPMDKTYWLAVGMGVGAFQMLTIDAVVTVQFGSAIKLGIFAVATADIPTSASSYRLAHVELGISAIADFDYGTLKIDAQLSPRSYILDPNCHLTGGFGLYYWFDSPHADKSVAGQYVFTLGGYHQAFDRPVGFPNPPRLGISWNLGGGLTMSGQAYFAITPKSCMAGGHLHAAFSAGPISAWFDAFADFLINYKPFYFNMQAGLSVGVSFSIDVWFIHIRISVEIGAQLYLWGPPIAGRVHVDLWVAAFDINFGADYSRNEVVSLLDFYLLVLQSQTGSSGFSATGNGGLGIASRDNDDGMVEAQGETSRRVNEGHNFLAQSGLLNPVDNPERNQNDDWIVRAGSFSFVVECKMAINAVKNGSGTETIISYGEVYSRPMKLTSPMSSTLTVVVQQEGESEPDEGWQYDKYLKSLPRALWAQYNSSTDPGKNGNNIRDLLNSDQGAVTLMSGVQITAPKPTMSLDPFPAYEVADADLQRLLSERSFPAIIEADDAWGPDQQHADGDIQEQYDAVVNAWSNPPLGEGDEGRQGFVGYLAEAFKWAVVDEMKSIAGIPERLRNGFMDLYVAAPLLTK
ncbi:hypothetical protein GGR58DRAFT_528184 [Xylaria digitata]|nr:hypothetical protein GGR58DRAFT_528184 [Xylaria digitata]